MNPLTLLRETGELIDKVDSRWHAQFERDLGKNGGFLMINALRIVVASIIGLSGKYIVETPARLAIPKMAGNIELLPGERGRKFIENPKAHWSSIEFTRANIDGSNKIEYSCRGKAKDGSIILICTTKIEVSSTLRK